MQPSDNKSIRRFYPILLVFIVILASVIMLSFVDGYTKGKIKAQQYAKTVPLIKEIFPDMSDYSFKDDIYVVKASGKTIGYAFVATGKGYGGTISIMVGLKDENTIAGVRIIAQTETKDLGSRITLPSFTDKFTGKKIDDIKLKSDGGAIDGITGSTISSRGVVDAVRTMALEKVKALPK